MPLMSTISKSQSSYLRIIPSTELKLEILSGWAYLMSVGERGYLVSSRSSPIGYEIAVIPSILN